MIPAALLVIAPFGASTDLPDDAISIDAQDVASGPLSVADALLRAASRSPSRD